MENLKLSDEDLRRINLALTDAGFPKVSNAKLEEATDDQAILRYIPNCDDRDAALGASALYRAGLQINNDGNPETTEEGMDQDTVPPSYVIMVKLPMWDER